eukprot:scaffold2720_cov173-Amphora_coffeaeformis.AAC.12
MGHAISSFRATKKAQRKQSVTSKPGSFSSSANEKKPSSSSCDHELINVSCEQHRRILLFLLKPTKKIGVFQRSSSSSVLIGSRT